MPFAWSLVALWAASHFLRAIGLTLAFHRYFAHRAFEMSRPARFVWAFIGTAAMQKGPIWWAGHHVSHHKFADRDGDPHSPSVSGFYYAHIGWFLHDAPQLERARAQPGDARLRRVPEIAWLERYYFVPPLLLALALYASAARRGWCGASACRRSRSRTPPSPSTRSTTCSARAASTRIDESRNNALTAFFAVGEGWHNNHHRYQRAARNGFYWWEFDPTWYVVAAMAMGRWPAAVLALEPAGRLPARIYAGRRTPGRAHVRLAAVDGGAA